jgi:hypothetical protein
MELFVSFTDAYSVPIPFIDAITNSNSGAIAHPFAVAGPLAYTLAIASYSIYTCIDC